MFRSPRKGEWVGRAATPAFQEATQRTCFSFTRPADGQDRLYRRLGTRKKGCGDQDLSLCESTCNPLWLALQKAPAVFTAEDLHSPCYMLQLPQLSSPRAWPWPPEDGSTRNPTNCHRQGNQRLAELSRMPGRLGGESFCTRGFVSADTNFLILSMFPQPLPTAAWIHTNSEVRPLSPCALCTHASPGSHG